MDWDVYISPDYFNVICPGTYRGIPVNTFGVSYAKEGAAYGGFLGYGKAGDTKEYVYQHLTAPLKTDSVYCLSFFVSRSDRTTYAIHSLGAYFSTSAPPTNSVYINAIPQIVNQNGYLTDTIGWTEIQGCYTALGGEQYVTFGNFNSNADTDTLFVGSTNPNPGANGYAYYYIDSVTLWQNNFPTAIKENSKNEIVNIYPNPAQDVLTIGINSIDKNNLSIQITDIVGRKVLYSDYHNQLNISLLEKGIYFVSVRRDGKVLVTKKIIKE